MSVGETLTSFSANHKRIASLLPKVLVGYSASTSLVRHAGRRGPATTWQPAVPNCAARFALHSVAKSVHFATYLVALFELGTPQAKVLDALLNHPRLSALVTWADQRVSL